MWGFRRGSSLITIPSVHLCLAEIFPLSMIAITIITRNVIIGPLYIRRTIWISTLAARIKFSIFHLVAVYRGIPRSIGEKEKIKGSRPTLLICLTQSSYPSSPLSSALFLKTFSASVPLFLLFLANFVLMGVCETLLERCDLGERSG